MNVVDGWKGQRGHFLKERSGGDPAQDFHHQDPPTLGEHQEASCFSQRQHWSLVLGAVGKDEANHHHDTPLAVREPTSCPWNPHEREQVDVLGRCPMPGWGELWQMTRQDLTQHG